MARLHVSQRQIKNYGAGLMFSRSYQLRSVTVTLQAAMVQPQTSETKPLKDYNTAELKQQLIEIAQPHDADSLSDKIKFYQQTLAPWVEELATRNPTPNLEEQAQLVVGSWTPIWSTIPFQDVLPGRRREQSYQIFREDGYYANIARYAPGMNLPLFRNLSLNLIVYDLMLIQKYEIQEQTWQIENITIKQALKLGASSLTIAKAQAWFEQEMASPFQEMDANAMKVRLPFSKKATQKASQQLKGAAKAKPKLEHLYIDQDFRLVKSQRESKQRPSYTITVRTQK